MQLWSTWSIAGVVVEARELTSQKNATWRGYVVKVQTLGQTFELQTDVDQHKKLAAGMNMAFAGRFEDQGGRQRFVVESMVDAAKAKAPQVVAS